MPSATSNGKDVIVLRLGEIFLKGKNRRFFERHLLKNARRLLKDVEGAEVEPLHLRLLVHHPRGEQQRCIDRLQRLFGLSSMSPARVVERNLDAITSEAVRQAEDLPAGTTFKVETNRRDKRFPGNSQEISRELGHRIIEATGLPVDVHDPQVTISVEISSERCTVHTRVVRGPGGLPVGTGGNVGLLLSGGIDSPVAGWSMMRRGCHVSAIYFHSFPYTGDKTKEKVLDLGRHLARYQGRFPVWVVPFTDVQKQLREHGKADLAVLLYRRMMMRAASILAERDACQGLVTGENIGQVASQTLENLRVIEDAAQLPVLRPLLCFDKTEIIERARSIGTYETSIQPYDDCCSLFVPKHPATRARIEDLVASEAGLDMGALAAQLADASERVVVEP